MAVASKALSARIAVDTLLKPNGLPIFLVKVVRVTRKCNQIYSSVCLQASQLDPRAESKSAVSDGKCELEQLLSGSHGHWFVNQERHRGSFLKSLLDPAYIQVAAGVTALETVQHFPCLVDSSRLVIKDPQRRIAARPFRQKIDGLLQTFRRLRGIAFQNGEQALTPEKFS